MDKGRDDLGVTFDPVANKVYISGSGSFDMNDLRKLDRFHKEVGEAFNKLAFARMERDENRKGRPRRFSR